MQNQTEIQMKKHTLFQSILLHLLPGFIIVLVYILIAPYFTGLGYPVIMALCFAIPLALIPSELFILFWVGRKINGRLSLKHVILYQTRTRLWSYLIYGIIIIVWSTICFYFLSVPLGDWMKAHVFNWLPEWFRSSNVFEGSKPQLIFTFVMIMLFGNILGPAVEELYFRGYLLPRIPSRKYAVYVNAGLFSIYHFWAPWDIITRGLAVLPVPWVTQHTKNIYIGMVAHIMLNILSTISLIPLLV